MKKFLGGLLFAFAVLFVCPLARAQNAPLYGFCTNGAQNVVLQGLTQTTPPGVMGAYAGCTVTVYLTGTTNLAPIFTAGGGALGNPFTANLTTGYWQFYAAQNVGVDITISGAGLPSSFTYGNVIPGGSGGGGGGGSGPPFVGPNPWIDFTAAPYYARAFNPPFTTTTATTNAGSPTATVASASTWQVHDGIVINQAGAATAQATPSAPTVTPVGVVGTATHQYKCVGVDVMGGLTAASPAGTITNGANVFGAPFVNISSISRASNVVTVNFSSAINAATNEHVRITGVTGGTTSFNGLYLIASAPSGTQITLAQTGSNESGTVSGTSYGRLTNEFIITAISRATTGVMTLTTDSTVNYIGVTGLFQAIINIDGVASSYKFNNDNYDMNGWYRIATASGTTITVLTPILPGATETGVGGGVTQSGTTQMTAVVYEMNDVVCPAISGTTVQYYVYANYGSGFNLVGKTYYLESYFWDFGPQWEKGFKAPSYVPTGVPPAVAQNQLYVGTVTGISGTTFTVSPNVPTAVIGQLAQHDDSLALESASLAAAANGGGGVFLPPAPAATGGNYYLFNAPTTLLPNGTPGSETLNVMLGNILQVNETIATGQDTVSFWGIPSATSSILSIGNRGTYSQIVGDANPMVAALAPDHGGAWGMTMDHVSFSSNDNGQNYVFSGGAYDRFTNVQWQSGDNPATVGFIVYSGYGFTQQFENVYWNGGMPFIWRIGQGAGQPQNGLPTPNLLIQNNTTSLAAVTITGINSNAQRGIMIDSVDFGFNSNAPFEHFENFETYQAPQNPFLMLYGNSGMDHIYLSHITEDSNFQPTIANIGGNGAFDLVTDSINSGISDLTGDPIPGYMALNESGATNTNNSGQNIDMEAPNVLGQLTNCGTSNPCPLIYGIFMTQHQEARPFNFLYGGNWPLFWEQPYVTGVTATATGSGSITGTFFVCVTTVGVANGGESIPGCTKLPVTFSAQNVQVSWNAVPNVLGYNVYSGNGSRQNASLIPAGTTSFTGSGGFSDTEPLASGTGLPLVDQTGMYALQFGTVTGAFKNILSTPTQTANRTMTAPDGASSLVVSASLTTTSATTDTVSLAGITSSSHCQISATNASAATNYTTTFLSAPTTGSIVVNHTATSGMTYSVTCSAN